MHNPTSFRKLCPNGDHRAAEGIWRLGVLEAVCTGSTKTCHLATIVRTETDDHFIDVIFSEPQIKRLSRAVKEFRSRSIVGTDRSSPASG